MAGVSPFDVTGKTSSPPTSLDDFDIEAGEIGVGYASTLTTGLTGVVKYDEVRGGGGVPSRG